MLTEKQLREKLRKIAALLQGATTAGERSAAAAALARVRAALAAFPEPPVEMRFSLADQWQGRLFAALCRRYGLTPYRYTRQRRTTVMLKVPRSFANNTLWPEYIELSKTLQEYLYAATERIVREEVFGDPGEASENAG